MDIKGNESADSNDLSRKDDESAEETSHQTEEFAWSRPNTSHIKNKIKRMEVNAKLKKQKKKEKKKAQEKRKREEEELGENVCSFVATVTM
jgi:septal ring factor EnvC (AmiA/AmiB activator)